MKAETQRQVSYNITGWNPQTYQNHSKSQNVHFEP